MTDFTLEQYVQREQEALAGFLRLYLAAARHFPEHFSLVQDQELWEEELRAYVECRNVNTDCLTCDPRSCHLVSHRLKSTGDT